ncbi:MAG: hypothetical protein TREMPRED_001860 [Tremellales sp. Tagirdzhanova-0007]|nr:MAG: hypothetical protein TREMPRED_001860 [Tremellales sp. Tagirdzhanova-0007]
MPEGSVEENPERHRISGSSSRSLSSVASDRCSQSLRSGRALNPISNDELDRSEDTIPIADLLRAALEIAARFSKCLVHASEQTPAKIPLHLTNEDRGRLTRAVGAMQRVCSDLVRVSTWINTAQSTFPFQEGAQVTTIRPAANDTSDCLITSTPPEPSSVLHAVDKVDRQSGKDFETDVPCPPALVTHGPWHHLETKRLHMLVDLSTTSSQGRTDWDWVSRKFGPTRSRHQVLCKAVELGLKKTGTRASRKVGQRVFRLAEAGMRGDLGVAAE